MRFLVKHILLILLTGIAAGMLPVWAQSQLPPGEWQEYRDGTLIVYAEAQDEEYAEQLTAMYDARLDSIARQLGLRKPRFVRVFIAPNDARFRYFTRGMPEWVGGAVFPSSRTVVLLSPRHLREHGQFTVTAVHEGVHLLTELDGESHLPRWLSEGLAMYFSGETMYKRKYPLARAVVTRRTYTLEQIEDVMRLGPEQARVAYLQSMHMVNYLVDNWGWDGIKRIVHGYRNGEDSDSLFIALTGHDLYDVEVAWHRSLREEFKWWQVLQLFDLDMLLWGGMSVFVMIVGGWFIIKRRRDLQDVEAAPDYDEIYSRISEPLPGDWYEEDD